jgi:hypothetical protein
VTISGFLDQDISSVVDKVRQIEGVKDVDNKITRLVLNISYGA